MNVRLLKAKIIENGMNVKDLAKAINVDSSTLYRYMATNGESLSIRKAKEIKQVLGLDNETVINIFFANEVV